MKAFQTPPKPLFGTLEQVCDLYKQCELGHTQQVIQGWLKNCLLNAQPLLTPDVAAVVVSEYTHALRFLYSYRGSLETFNAYRRELDRLLLWSWLVRQKPILQLKRLDIEAFIEFCQNPPKKWVGTKTVARFITKNGDMIANPDWRPFIAKISKKAFQDGERAEKGDFELSQQGIKQIFAILGSFYNALIQEEITETNPVVQIRQKSKFIQKNAQNRTVRRLSDAQWHMVLKATRHMALESPEKHRRTLFMLQLLYGLYLRISELAASNRWTPKMCDFFRDTNGDWWFKTVGKGNKMRQIAVSDTMLEALKEYRTYLGLSPLPAPDDQIPLIHKEKGKGPLESTRVIRHLIQQCFDAAVRELKRNNGEEAEMLRSATVHWLRHTGISEDVKHRPREHVRDDAGHSSSSITDRYIDVELKARANTAKNKSW